MLIPSIKLDEPKAFLPIFLTDSGITKFWILLLKNAFSPIVVKVFGNSNSSKVSQEGSKKLAGICVTPFSNFIERTYLSLEVEAVGLFEKIILPANNWSKYPGTSEALIVVFPLMLNILFFEPLKLIPWFVKVVGYVICSKLGQSFNASFSKVVIPELITNSENRLWLK